MLAVTRERAKEPHGASGGECEDSRMEHSGCENALLGFLRPLVTACPNRAFVGAKHTIRERTHYFFFAIRGENARPGRGRRPAFHDSYELLPGAR